MSQQLPQNSLDKPQFEELFKSHFAYLCNFAKQFVFDEEVAQDIVQKVFISLWEKREEIGPSVLFPKCAPIEK